MQRMKSGSMTMDRGEPLDFKKLVNSVADKFENETGMKVKPKARLELINPALPHQKTVEKALNSGEITRDFLEDSLKTVLRNAMDIAKEWKRDEIGEETTKESMKRYCPYLFWC